MQFRQLMLTVFALAMAGAAPVPAQDSLAPLAGDSVLQSLVAEALEHNPGLAGRQAAVRAAELRVRPAGAFPDPMLMTGVIVVLLPNFNFNQSDFTEVDA